MTAPSITPLWDSLHQKAIDRLLAEAPRYEFLILKGHLLVEQALDILIDGALKRPARLRARRRLTFDFKLALACALGLVPAKHAVPIEALNKIRNKIAHIEGYALTVKDLLDLRLDWDDKLVARIKRDFVSDPNEATSMAVSVLIWSCFELVGDYEMQKKRSSKRVVVPTQ